MYVKRYRINFSGQDYSVLQIKEIVGSQISCSVIQYLGPLLRLESEIVRAIKIVEESKEIHKGGSHITCPFIKTHET